MTKKRHRVIEVVTHSGKPPTERDTYHTRPYADWKKLLADTAEEDVEAGTAHPDIQRLVKDLSLSLPIIKCTVAPVMVACDDMSMGLVNPTDTMFGFGKLISFSASRSLIRRCEYVRLMTSLDSSPVALAKVLMVFKDGGKTDTISHVSAAYPISVAQDLKQAVLHRINTINRLAGP